MTKPYSGPCRANKRCPAMAMALDGGPRAGLVVGWAFPDMTEHVMYKPKPKSAGIILNLCPWCGAKLNRAPKARARSKEGKGTSDG